MHFPVRMGNNKENNITQWINKMLSMEAIEQCDELIDVKEWNVVIVVCFSR